MSGPLRTWLRPGRLLPLAALGVCLALWAAMFLHHAMWRDELQAWQIATASPTPVDLYWNMRYEGHPGLWHLVLWLGAQVSADPAVMRVIQAGIALAIFALIAFRSPFSWLERLLLISSYFLLYLYAVLARSYGLGVLLLLLAVQTQARRPWLGWLFLGLAANTSVYGALASMALALALALDRARPLRRMAGGMAIYGALLALAIVWMMPAADSPNAYNWLLHYDPRRFLGALGRLPSAFLPTDPLGLGLRMLRDTELPAGAARTLGVLIATVPILALALVALGERRTMIAFAAAAAAIVAFHYVKHPGSARHYGTIFIAFVACLWLARARPLPPRLLSRAAAVLLLALNAASGLFAVGDAMSRPFSMAEATADFIRASYPEDVFLAGYRDSQVSNVAGHLARPIYYPQCDCLGTFIRWGQRPRELPLDPDSVLWARLRAHMAAGGMSSGVLVLNRRIDPAVIEERWPDLSLVLRRAFTGSVMADEQFYVYDLGLAAGAPAP